MFEIQQDQLFKDGKPYIFEGDCPKAEDKAITALYPQLKRHCLANPLGEVRKWGWFEDVKYINAIKGSTPGEALMYWRGDRELMLKAFDERLFCQYLSQGEIDLIDYFLGRKPY